MIARNNTNGIAQNTKPVRDRTTKKVKEITVTKSPTSSYGMDLSDSTKANGLINSLKFIKPPKI
jgi:tRNA A37 methylthiotransferase MiaB